MRILLLALLIIPTLASAQDRADYFGGMDLHDGLYRDFKSFRTNRPTVPLEALRDASGHPIGDLRRVSGKLYWQPDTGAQQAIDLGRLWGFCQNDVVYIAANNGFYRIGMMGSLSHMVVEETYRDWDPYMYHSGTVTRTVLVQQLLDMETGEFLPFNASGIDKALLHDEVLSEEFRALPKKQRNKDETLYRFMRMYNDRHPLIFPP